MNVRKWTKENKRTVLLWLVLTLYAGISLGYLFNLMTGGTVFTQSAFTILLFAGVGMVLTLPLRDWGGMGKGSERRRRIRYSCMLSFLLGISFVLGYQIRMEGSTSLGVKGKLFIILVSMGIGVAFLPAANAWFRFLSRGNYARDTDGTASTVTPGHTSQSREDTGNSDTTDNAHAKAGTHCRIFLLSWLGIFLCWLPAFFAYYPAIMSYDFNRQSQEAIQGYIWFNTHHPLIHTFLIRVFLLLGEALGSYEVGMAIFSLLQMLILSCVFAYSCQMIARLSGKIWPAVVTAVIFALLPIHPVLALSITKDILFTAFFLLFLLLALERRMYRGGKVGKILLSVALVLSGILMIMFRNNAVYAFAVFIIFYIIWSKRERLQITLLCVLILVGGVGCKEAMQSAMQAGSGSQAEMYSVFMQQFCRVGLNQGSSLSEEDWEIINYYVASEYWEDYNPAIADSIKGNVTVTTYQVWKDDIGQMLQDWVHIGLKYINDYIDAFLALTSGYWFLDDVSHAEVLGYGEDTDLGLLYTFNVSSSDVFDGVESHSYLPGLLKIYQKIVNGNCYYNWPVICNLFKPAFYDWLLMLSVISLFYQRRYGKVCLCMLPVLYLLTLFLGPTVHMRYAYPIVASAPLLLTWAISPLDLAKAEDFRRKRSLPWTALQGKFQKENSQSENSKSESPQPENPQPGDCPVGNVPADGFFVENSSTDELPLGELPLEDASGENLSAENSRKVSSAMGVTS